jgi:hypothetical protein
MTERLRENSRTAVYFFDESPAKEQAEGTLQEKYPWHSQNALTLSPARSFAPSSLNETKMYRFDLNFACQK